uniref:Uncharacterized protein n=1 Tax=Oryza nivara TaxID=4536 RepID=A0A0E0G923_ORYNI
MAAEVWKAQFGRLVEEAAIRVDGVREGLHALLPQLTSSSSSMVAGDANTVRDTIQLALDALGLGDESSVNYLAEQSAAIKLSYAESDARKAYALVDGCRGHLDAALLLLDHVGRLPDVQGMINAERLAAVADLEAAIVAVQRSAEMATAARQDVSGAS